MTNKLRKISIVWSNKGPRVNMHRDTGKVNGLTTFNPYRPTKSSLMRLQAAMSKTGLLGNWGHGTFQSNCVSLNYEIPRN